MLHPVFLHLLYVLQVPLSTLSPKLSSESDVYYEAEKHYQGCEGSNDESILITHVGDPRSDSVASLSVPISKSFSKREEREKKKGSAKRTGSKILRRV